MLAAAHRASWWFRAWLPPPYSSISTGRGPHPEQSCCGDLQDELQRPVLERLRPDQAPVKPGVPRCGLCGRDRGTRQLPVRVPARPGRAGRRQRSPRVGRDAPGHVRHLHRALLRLVHTRPMSKVARWRAADPSQASYCSYGRRMSCGQRHKNTDACLGRPLSPRLLRLRRYRRLEYARTRAMAPHHHRHSLAPRPARPRPG